MVFPPWWTASRAMAAAASAGDILGVGGLPFVVIVHRDSTGVARGASSVGALFVVDADTKSMCSSLWSDSKS
jgi:hypothetical protein